MSKPRNGNKLDKALMAFRRAMDESLLAEAKRSGCSLSHFETVKFVAERGDPSMKDIAGHLRVTPPSASALVETLVTRELLVRRQAEGDRRTVHVSLAPKAFALFASLKKRRASIFEKMLSKLDPDEKDLFADLLTKCIS
jgi:DNA-binding MarR family transcriptional regulator